MSWRTGSKLFWAIWPLVKQHVPDDDFRCQFLQSIVKLFLDFDVDPSDLRGKDPEVDATVDRVDSSS